VKFRRPPSLIFTGTKDGNFGPSFSTTTLKVKVPGLTTPYSNETVGVEASGCERLAHGRYAAAPRPGNRTNDLLISSPTPYRCATTPHNILGVGGLCLYLATSNATMATLCSHARSLAHLLVQRGMLLRRSLSKPPCNTAYCDRVCMHRRYQTAHARCRNAICRAPPTIINRRAATSRRQDVMRQVDVIVDVVKRRGARYSDHG